MEGKKETAGLGFVRASPIRLINSELFLTGPAFPPKQGIEQGLSCRPDSGFFPTPDKLSRHAGYI